MVLVYDFHQILNGQGEECGGLEGHMNILGYSKRGIRDGGNHPILGGAQ